MIIHPILRGVGRRCLVDKSCNPEEQIQDRSYESPQKLTQHHQCSGQHIEDPLDTSNAW